MLDLKSEAQGREAPDPHPAPGRAAPVDERLVSEVPRAERKLAVAGDRTLEDVVRDLLRPLLKAWLDENLPEIVERLARAEIARVVDRPRVG